MTGCAEPKGGGSNMLPVWCDVRKILPLNETRRIYIVHLTRVEPGRGSRSSFTSPALGYCDLLKSRMFTSRSKIYSCALLADSSLIII